MNLTKKRDCTNHVLSCNENRTQTKEVAFALPGDELVMKPDFNATRGISVSAPAEEVWKWIIQIGSKRAGWYSIDWMDNAGIKSKTAQHSVAC
jgi:hypothetical protein